MPSTFYNDIKTVLMKEVSTPYEKYLMLTLGILFIISGIYELSLYPNGIENKNSIEGLFILLISFRILTGDTVIGNFNSSPQLAILGSVGIAISVLGLLIPTIMTGVVGTVSALIIAVYAIACIVGPILNTNKESLRFRSVCFVFGILLLLLTINNLGVKIFRDYDIAGITLVIMGVLIIMMAIFRTRFVDHRKDDFPIISLTILITGLSLFCCIIAGVLSGGDQSIFSLNGSMAIFTIAIGIKILSVGNTPFGNIRRSRLAIAIGVFCISITMLAIIMPYDGLKSLLSITLGSINMLGGLYLVNMLLRKKGLPSVMPVRFTIASLSMILFGFNRLLPGIFAGEFLLFTLILFAFTMTSIGATIFSITMSNKRKSEKEGKKMST